MSRRVAITAVFFVDGALFATWASRIPALSDHVHAGAGILGLCLLAPAAAAVVSMPVTLLDEAERAVERQRRLVVREDVQLELRDARPLRPRDGLFQQRPPDPAAPVAGGDHQAEIGHVAAGGMGIPPDREAADDPVRSLGDEDGRVRVAPQGAQVAALVGDTAPAVADQPALGLGPDGAPERHERRRIARLGRTDDELVAHSTTAPAPPRLGSPAAASVPSSRNSTPAAPPKKRFRRRQRRRS